MWNRKAVGLALISSGVFFAFINGNNVSCSQAFAADSSQSLKPQKERLHNVFELDEVMAQRRAGNYEVAFKYVEEFLATNQDPYKRAWGVLEKALLLELMGKPQQALELHDKNIELDAKVDPTLFSSVLYEKSKVLSKLNRQEEAIRTLKEALDVIKDVEISSFDGEFRKLQMSIRLGLYYRLAERTLDAENILQAIITQLHNKYNRSTTEEKKRLVNIEISVAYRELAETYLLEHKLDEAGKYAKKGLEILNTIHCERPHHPEINMMNNVLDRINSARNAD